MRRVRVLVSGRVQGVGFRYATQAEADTRGVNGWARNLSDGRVEVEIEAPEDAVHDFVSWLHHGPPGAEVEQVELSELPTSGNTGFVVFPTR